MVDEPMSFGRFRRSFHFGAHSDMQARLLAARTDAQAADALAHIVAALGEAFDSADLEPVRNAQRCQVLIVDVPPNGAARSGQRIRSHDVA